MANMTIPQINNSRKSILTKLTENSTETDTFNRHTIIINNSVVIAVSGVTLILQVMFLVALKKCRKLPLQIKWLSINNAVTDIIYRGVTITMTVGLLVIDENHFSLIYYSRIVMLSALYAVNWATTVGFALERLITLSQPFHYQKWYSPLNCAVYIIGVWLINCVIPISIFTIQVTRWCKWNFNTCSHAAMLDTFRIVYACLFSMNWIIILVSLVKVTGIVNSQIQEIKKVTLDSSDIKSKHFKITSASLGVIITYSVLNVPVLVFSFIFFIKPDLKNPFTQQILLFINFVCASLSSYISLYVYIWKVPECRLHFLQLFCSSNREKYIKSIQKLKSNVYNIGFLPESG